MKRPVFIIIGALLVFVLLGIWIYILFFGSPTNNSDTFADLNFGDTTDGTFVVTELPPETSTVDINGPERLRQLTTKPTIGYQEIMRDASSTPEILYIEGGTGKIFSINIATGEEKRISATTVPLSSTGVITPNGKFVMIQSGTGAGSEFTIGEISTSSETLVTLKINERVIDFESSTDNTFLYAVQTSNSVIAKEYNPETNVSKTLFTMPFREVIIDWGKRASDVHYAYPKASSKLEGFLYQITGSQIKRLPVDGYGLSAAGTVDSVIYSKQVGGKYKTYFYTHKNGSSLQSAVKIIPEKCTPLSKTTTKAICGTTLSTYDETAPDSWYKGIASYADDLWEIDTNINGALLLSKTLAESGRELDLIHPMVNKDDTNFYFLNKKDNSLWMYELVPAEENNQ